MQYIYIERTNKQSLEMLLIKEGMKMCISMQIYFLSCLCVCCWIFPSEVMSCSCTESSYKECCTADFVIKADIGKEAASLSQNFWFSRVYEMCVSKIYKLTFDVKNIDFSRLYTVPLSICGASFEPGTYVITGEIEFKEGPPKLALYGCTYHRKWSQLNETEISFFENPVCK